jgi:hypothetical protein
MRFIIYVLGVVCLLGKFCFSWFAMMELLAMEECIIFIYVFGVGAVFYGWRDGL